MKILNLFNISQGKLCIKHAKKIKIKKKYYLKFKKNLYIMHEKYVT